MKSTLLEVIIGGFPNLKQGVGRTVPSPARILGTVRRSSPPSSIFYLLWFIQQFLRRCTHRARRVGVACRKPTCGVGSPFTAIRKWPGGGSTYCEACYEDLRGRMLHKKPPDIMTTRQLYDRTTEAMRISGMILFTFCSAATMCAVVSAQ